MSGDERKWFDAAVARAQQKEDFWQGKYDEYEAKGDEKGMERAHASLLKAQDAVAATEAHRAALVLGEQRARSAPDERTAAAGLLRHPPISTVGRMDEDSFANLTDSLAKLHAWCVPSGAPTVAGAAEGIEAMALDAEDPFVGSYDGVIDISPLRDAEGKLRHEEDKLFQVKSGCMFPRSTFCTIWRKMAAFHDKTKLKETLYLQGAPGCGKSLLCFMYCIRLASTFNDGKKIHYFRRFSAGMVVYYRFFRDRIEYCGPVSFFTGVNATNQDYVRQLVAKDFTVIDGATKEDCQVWTPKLVCSSTHLFKHGDSASDQLGLILSPWVEEEVLQAFDQGCFDGTEMDEKNGRLDLTEEMIKKRYYYVGGAMRELLFATWRGKRWADNVVNGISGSEREKYLSGTGKDRVVRTFASAQNGFESGQATIDARYMLEKLVKDVGWLFNQRLLIAGRALGGTLYGNAFELALHKFVKEFGYLDYRNVVCPRGGVRQMESKPKRLGCETSGGKLDFQYLSLGLRGEEEQHVMNQLTSIQSTNYYWCPELSNFPTVDAGLRVGNDVYLLQATVQKSKRGKCDYEMAERVADTMGAQGNRYFVYVIPEERVATFQFDWTDAFQIILAVPTFDSRDVLGEKTRVPPQGYVRPFDRHHMQLRMRANKRTRRR